MRAGPFTLTDNGGAARLHIPEELLEEADLALGGLVVVRPESDGLRVVDATTAAFGEEGAEP